MRAVLVTERPTATRATAEADVAHFKPRQSHGMPCSVPSLPSYGCSTFRRASSAIVIRNLRISVPTLLHSRSNGLHPKRIHLAPRTSLLQRHVPPPQIQISPSSAAVAKGAVLAYHIAVGGGGNLSSPEGTEALVEAGMTVALMRVAAMISPPRPGDTGDVICPAASVRILGRRRFGKKRDVTRLPRAETCKP